MQILFDAIYLSLSVCNSIFLSLTLSFMGGNPSGHVRVVNVDMYDQGKTNKKKTIIFIDMSRVLTVFSDQWRQQRLSKLDK